MSEAGAGALPAGEPAPGEVHGGCRLERLLGRGGMGSAYLATAPDGRPVVVKFLAAHMAKEPHLCARFEREWSALRKIHDHPHVVRVLDVQGAAARPLIVMELVEGASLDALLERGRLPAAQATQVARDVGRGLAAVHAHGLIHRDVKPGNIIVGPDGRAKIVDFGLAKDLFLTGLTKPGQLLGTALYMAPEQWEDEGVDTRADIFALGATLYHLLTGRPPFDSDDLDEIADRALSGDYPPPRALASDVPADLELVLHGMLAPDLGQRYPRIEDCVADLERVLRGEPPSVPMLVVPEGGARLGLVKGEFFTLGSEAGCDLVVAGPGVAPRHAQLRRQGGGFVLRDLQSPQGTCVGQERLTPGQGRTLEDGDELRLGGARVVYRDPRRRSQAVSFLQDVERRAVTAPVARALEALGDRRAVLGLLEQLAADPSAEREADQALTALLGPDVARAVSERRQRTAAEERARLPAHLTAMTGVPAPVDPLAWLAWWHQVRLGAPPQAVVPVAPRRTWLRTQGASPPQLPLGELGVVLVGRDERCQVRVEDPRAPRLAATLLRLQRRWVVLSEGAAALDGRPVRQAFLDPGATLAIGAALLRLEQDPAPDLGQVGDGLLVVDARSYEVLEAEGHPSVAGALVGFLFAARHPEWIPGAAAELFPDDPARARALAEALGSLFARRAQRARLLLPRLLGQEAGEDPAAWERLLAGRRAQLGPQVAPFGWSRPS